MPGGRGVAREPKAVVASPGTPCGQKMPNMSTVANLVTYRSSEIIDKVINMFIYVSTQKPANGRFDQFEGV